MDTSARSDKRDLSPTTQRRVNIKGMLYEFNEPSAPSCVF